MAQINHKAVRSLSKLMEAGFDSEKAVLNMTMDDILSLPGITVAEIGMINEIQESSESREIYHIFGRRGDMNSGNRGRSQNAWQDITQWKKTLQKSGY